MTEFHRVRPKRTSPISTRRAARLSAFLGVPAALIASGLFISNASYAAFSSTTVNPSSSWTTGTVGLSDDDSNTALFTASGLKPGSTGQKCIAVTSTGTLPSSVKLYTTSVPAANGLTSAMTLTVEQGTGGSFGSCTGFSPDTAVGTAGTIFTGTFSAFGAVSNFANGVGTWTPSGSAAESKTYRITYLLPSNAASAAQGLTTQLGLTWESQNT